MQLQLAKQSATFSLTVQVWRCSEAIQVPAVTVQPDKELKQCADLHFPLNRRDWE
jgi:hypothetical protein